MWGDVVKHRDDDDNQQDNDWPLSNIPHGQEQAGKTQHTARGLGYRATENEQGREYRNDNHGKNRHAQRRGPEPDQAPALVDFIDPVHGTSESAHVARSGPEGPYNADREGEACGL